MNNPSRRQVIAVAAATVSLPMIESAVGKMRSARANATPAGGAPAAGRPGGAAPAAGGRNAAPEKAGWFATTLKPADVKEGEFNIVKDHAIVLTVKDKEITALSSRCTHQGCDLVKGVKAGQNIVTCPCHGAQFNLDGTVAKAPAKTPLDHYAIRTNANGLIEIDPGTKPKSGEDNFSLKVGA